MTDTYQERPYLGADELNTMTINRNVGLPSLKKTCFIQPKSTGFASLFLQFGLLIVSGLTAIFFFYHVGGYEYMEWNENSTILQPVHHYHGDEFIETEISIPLNNPVIIEPATNAPEPDDSLVSTTNRSLEFINATIANNMRDDKKNTVVDDDESISNIIESLLGDSGLDNATFGIEQVPMTTVVIAGIEFDWLEVIRISTLVYLAICLGWFFTMFLFICTIRCEILDTAILNLIILITIVLYLLVHSVLIGALLFFQTQMSWRTMAITIGSIVILSCCAFLGSICVALNFGWVRYIDYMHNTRKCMCLGMIVRLIKRNKRQNMPDSYSMPERRPEPTNNIQYETDVPIQQFSAF
ncbi:unnamed protein product [Caenorhabditis bovis]|uniref:Uncharacterized protein n=1 Tax=Caenorhabditis bovis TaxID=2654633 RepID=A0A8S1EN58_9PELO|nr:unnamed protein product [Caenorhabditis bovis]